MTTRIGKKRLIKEIKMYQNENFKFENLILRPQENNLLKWYFIIYNLKETPFENGIYFGKVLLPDEYPLKPPDFIFLTPNGRFETNTKICTTFSAYHMETYSSAWNILTMMEGLISYMTDTIDNQGIGSMQTTDIEKRHYAEKSIEWNMNNSEFNSIFPDIENLI
jgi:ubiquitin-conjugating enzyme E2 J2